MDNNNNLIKQNLRELQRLTLLNILSAKGIIYTHYKNKQLNKGKYNEQKNKSRALGTNI
jgi:cell division protein FtsL